MWRILVDESNARTDCLTFLPVRGKNCGTEWITRTMLDKFLRNLMLALLVWLVVGYMVKFLLVQLILFTR